MAVMDQRAVAPTSGSSTRSCQNSAQASQKCGEPYGFGRPITPSGYAAAWLHRPRQRRSGRDGGQQGRGRNPAGDRDGRRSRGCARIIPGWSDLDPESSGTEWAERACGLDVYRCSEGANLC